MVEPSTIVTGFVERETVTGKLRTRLIHFTEDVRLENPEGGYDQISEGSCILVVDRVGDEQPLVEQLLDAAELWYHCDWGAAHGGEETRTPLDLRTPEYGGRETEEVIPF